MAATVPVKVTVAVPLPVTDTLADPVALIWPEPTVKVTLMVFSAESTSPTAIPKPVSDRAVCSVALGRSPSGLVITGASLTATTATVREIAKEFCVLRSPELSVTVTAIWRTSVLGFSELLLNVTLRKAL